MDPIQDSSVREPSNGMRDISRDGDAAAIKEAAMEAASSVNTLYEVSQEFLAHQTKQRPYAVLGAAAGVGFILGGGLASRFARILLSIGGRVVATQVLEGSLDGRDLDQ
jgi:hypothetical protein